jgi:hypothetical protein
MNNIWLFRFTSYSYCPPYPHCRGTSATYHGNMRLLHFSSPCDELEAKNYLKDKLISEGIDIDFNSIECLTIKIQNS